MIEAKLIQAKLDLIYPIITYTSCKHFVAQWIMHPYSQSHLRGSKSQPVQQKLFFISTRALTAPDLQIIRHRTRCN
jgi:hypothetical protein